MERESVVRLHAGGRPARLAAQGRRGAVATDDGAAIAGDRKVRRLPTSEARVALIAAKEKRMESLTGEGLRDRTAALRARLSEEAKAQGG